MNERLRDVEFRDEGITWRVLRVTWSVEHREALAFYAPLGRDRLGAADFDRTEYSTVAEVDRWIRLGRLEDERRKKDKKARLLEGKRPKPDEKVRRSTPRLFRVGDAVDAKYAGGGRQFYPGTVTTVRADGTYDIAYDDGSRETHVVTSAIRARRDVGWCYCGLEAGRGDMIACDALRCSTGRGWFHIACTGLAAPPPTGQLWFCRRCARDGSRAVVEHLRRAKGWKDEPRPAKRPATADARRPAKRHAATPTRRSSRVPISFPSMAEYAKPTTPSVIAPIYRETVRPRLSPNESARRSPSEGVAPQPPADAPPMGLPAETAAHAAHTEAPYPELLAIRAAASAASSALTELVVCGVRLLSRS